MKVAVMGHGVVGSGVVEVLLKNADIIANRVGEAVEVKHILDLRDFGDLSYNNLFTKEFNDICNDDEVKVVAEVMGGVNPAFQFTKECLSRGKSVVTSNKELVAQHGAELFEVAKANNVNYFIEASVGGGIPVIKPMHLCLDANEITEVAGILNGTTNFILTKMITENMSFEDALKTAQELGYAEKDPTADVEGIDAGRKICILSSLAFGKHIYPEYITTQGITKITALDVAFAGKFSSVIKLVGRGKILENGKVALTVSPALLNKTSQLANVSDVFNAVVVRGDAVGEVMFYGPGAGKHATASAVVSDMMDAAKNKQTCHTLQWADGDGSLVEPFENYTNPFFMSVQGDVSVVKEIVGDFADSAEIDGAIGFLTSAISNKELADKTAQLESRGVKVLSSIPVLDY